MKKHVFFVYAALGISAGSLFAQEVWPSLNETPLYEGNSYLGDTESNISLEAGFEGDIAAHLNLGGTGKLSIYASASDKALDGNAWLKLDSNSYAEKASGTVSIGVGKGVSDDMNLLFDGYRYAGGTTDIWVVGGGTVGGNVNVVLNNSKVENLQGIYGSGTCIGDINFTLVDSEVNVLNAAHYSGPKIGGSVNASLKNSNVNGAIVLLNGNWGPDAIVDGDVNFVLDGGTVNGMVRLGPNNSSNTSGFVAGRVKGDINAVFGGHYDEQSGTFVKSEIETYVKATDGGLVGSDESILMTGGRKGAADGNVNLVIVSGTYDGTITMGPNAATLGSAEDPNSGNATLTILGGTFNDKIYAASHNYSSTGVFKGDGVIGEVLGDARFNVKSASEPIVFNADIYIGALTGNVIDLSLFGKELHTRENFLRGDAVATFEGDMSNIVFKNGVRILGKTSTTNVGGEALFYFKNATGNFGAKIDGFDEISFDANSDITMNADIVGETLVFLADSVEAHGRLSVENAAEIAAETITIVLDESFIAEDGDIMDLILAPDLDLSGIVLSMILENGEAYDALPWYAYYEDGLSIVFGTVPEPSAYAAFLGVIALALAAYSRRK